MDKKRQPIVAIKTFGCKVNRYESEAILESFKKEGYAVAGEEDFADVYVINTCTVTKLSDRKSRQYIRRVKRINPESITCVVGCYAQVSPEEVAAIQGVDIIAGTNEKLNLYKFVEEKIDMSIDDNESLTAEKPLCYVKDFSELKEFVDTGSISSMENRTRAYIKIQEGCNQFCSYCIIPYARGNIRSRSVKSILSEIEVLLKEGFKEIVLTGINTALYGCEDGFSETDNDEKGILGLLKKIDRIENDFRIRLSSLEPTVVNAEYVKGLFGINKLCHHLHLSIQSGSDKVLKSMKRHYDRKKYMEIVSVLRDFDPNYGITTDIIVGFPGESEEDFTDTVNIVENVNFSHCHIFPYSIRQGTLAAKMKDQVNSSIKSDRVKKLLGIADKQEHIFRNKLIGSNLNILIEEYIEDIDCFRGYSDNYVRCYINKSSLDSKGLGTDNLINRFITARGICETEDGLECEI